MASLAPKALHVLSALKAELLSRPAPPEGVAPAKPLAVERPTVRRADRESRQVMRRARRSKATVASRYYQQGLNW